MALATALAALCPALGSAQDPPLEAGSVQLSTRDGLPVACHAAVLRARCPDLPDGSVVETGEDAEVVYALLRWVYCEQVSSDPMGAESTWPSTSAEALTNTMGIGARAVRLGRRWGLRDAACLQGRVAARRVVTRGSGTLVEDVLRAYDAGALDGRISFQAENKEEPTEALKGGWTALLRQRSGYFAAMLGGHWAESCAGSDEVGDITVHWPRRQLARLLRFVHGAPFVQAQEDLRAAVECAKFFSVPSLFAEVNEWIASHLTFENATGLWNFVESEPLVKHCDGTMQEGVADADMACFDFHLQHFEDLVAGCEHRAEPLEAYGITCGRLRELDSLLMQRLLATGLVDMCSDLLRPVVLDYARDKTKGRPREEFADLCERLRPPAVLFNRQHRDSFLPVGTITARSFV